MQPTINNIHFPNTIEITITTYISDKYSITRVLFTYIFWYLHPSIAGPLWFYEVIF